MCQTSLKKPLGAAATIHLAGLQEVKFITWNQGSPLFLLNSGDFTPALTVLGQQCNTFQSASVWLPMMRMFRTWQLYY